MMENNTPKIWDSITNIVLIIMVLAMVVFTYNEILPVEIFSSALSVVLGAFFYKGGQKDGHNAAINLYNPKKERKVV